MGNWAFSVKLSGGSGLRGGLVCNSMGSRGLVVEFSGNFGFFCEI